MQYCDVTNILNVNSDDVAGFHLDTLATHNQHPTPIVGQPTPTMLTSTKAFSRLHPISENESESKINIHRNIDWS